MTYQCTFCGSNLDEDELHYEAHSCLERRYPDGEEEWSCWWTPRCPVCGCEELAEEGEDEEDET